MHSVLEDKIAHALDGLAIELPSWAFANSGTRFEIFTDPAAANNIDEKLADAGCVHALTGCCPSVAVHVLWDYPDGVQDAARVSAVARHHGVRIGAINPNVYQGQMYKHGSLGNPDPAIRQAALQHILDSIEIASCPEAAISRSGSQMAQIIQAPQISGSAAPGLLRACRRCTRI